MSDHVRVASHLLHFYTAFTNHFRKCQPNSHRYLFQNPKGRVVQLQGKLHKNRQTRDIPINCIESVWLVYLYTYMKTHKNQPMGNQHLFWCLYFQRIFPTTPTQQHPEAQETSSKRLLRTVVESPCELLISSLQVMIKDLRSNSTLRNHLWFWSWSSTVLFGAEISLHSKAYRVGTSFTSYKWSDMGPPWKSTFFFFHQCHYRGYNPVYQRWRGPPCTLLRSHRYMDESSE